MPPRPPDTPARRLAANAHARKHPTVPWRWRLIRSWPEGLPFDEAMADRLELDLESPTPKRPLQERFERSGRRLGRIRAWHAVVFCAWWAVPWWLVKGVERVTGADLGPFAFVPLFFLGWAVITWWMTKTVWRPRRRAMMRREAVDCCVRCGQLMARGLEADRCPECGFDHAAFPLGWGPEPSDAPA